MPDHCIAKLVSAASDSGYIKYYKELQHKFESIEQCNEILTNQFKSSFETKVQDAAAKDPDSKLGTYLAINPTLSKPSYEDKLEFQRVCISRYRTGSHNLKIESGRVPYTPREERLCRCSTGVQTISHVMLNYPLLNGVREKHGVVDIVNGIMNDNFLIEMEQVLHTP